MKKITAFVPKTKMLVDSGHDQGTALRFVNDVSRAPNQFSRLYLLCCGQVCAGMLSTSCWVQPAQFAFLRLLFFLQFLAESNLLFFLAWSCVLLFLARIEVKQNAGGLGQGVAWLPRCPGGTLVLLVHRMWVVPQAWHQNAGTGHHA